jgi:hypothetical protein
MAQVATNDKFFASNHRVLQSSTRERFSRAFFFNPSHSVDIQPLQLEAVGGAFVIVRLLNNIQFIQEHAVMIIDSIIRQCCRPGNEARDLLCNPSHSMNIQPPQLEAVGGARVNLK